MSETTYKVDTIHSGLRLVSAIAILIGAFLGSFVIVPALARMLGFGEALPFVVPCLGGAAIGMGAGWAVERYLHVIWPSGRWLKVDDEGVSLHERSGKTIQIKWADPVDVLSWHFVVRRARVSTPKGWYCVACRLAQEDRVITPYSFLSPTNAQAVAQWKAFPELISRKHSGRQEVERSPQRADGQEPLWAAEKDRWEDGAEMIPVDFAALLAALEQRLTGWPG